MFLASVPLGAFWVDRDFNPFAADLAASGKMVLPTIVHLSTFLSSSPPLIENRVAPTMPGWLAPIDPYLRACTLSRSIGLAMPDDPSGIGVRKHSHGARRIGTHRPGAFGITFADVRDAGAFRAVRAFVH